MKFAMKAGVAAALSAVAVAASAMTPIADEGLSQVSGQDGVSLAASLNVNVGSFQYTNTTESASISFNDIKFTGLIAATIDVINGAHFAEIRKLGTGSPTPVVDGSFFNVASDVVQIAIPDASKVTLPTAALLDMSVAAIKMNGSDASFGKIALTDIDLRGTSVWIWAH
ncbi:DUF6160 family protein [Noviherbaspirillum massiliense]|uniref:DUF6160 family protein n=1 Tax=Noviherbaspirillum massiliense TaxID=1465823 RepID=UPI00031CBE46|nr:DUF6160 family protein [Noviherbaspirillum massiliense]